ncbi:hypothetical protein [Streptomyces sp. NPDC086777]|uniref:hypothetical protein n=1 Tax=Streptomyces sp. NPDC086777 TaxID=3154866 RepID=UPI00344EF21B
MIYWTGWDVTWKIMVVALMGFALFVLARQRGDGERTSVHLRHGWWILLWYGGLTLIGYLGSYPAADRAAGNLGLLSTPSALGADAVLALVVLVVAVRNAPERVLYEPADDSPAPAHHRSTV